MGDVKVVAPVGGGYVGLSANASRYAQFRHLQASDLSDGSVVMFQSESGGESMRIMDDKGTMGSCGGTGTFAQWKVHRVPTAAGAEPRVMLESIHFPGKYLRIQHDGAINADGHGGELCEFDVVQFDNGTVALRSVAWTKRADPNKYVAFTASRTAASSHHTAHPPEIRLKPFLAK